MKMETMQTFTKRFFNNIYGVQPLIIITKLSILDFALVLYLHLNTENSENFSISLYCGTFIVKCSDLVERSNLQSVTKDFLTGWNAVFIKKFALFCNTFICKLNFFCSPRLKPNLLRLLNVLPNLFEEIMNEFIENTGHTRLK